MNASVIELPTTSTSSNADRVELPARFILEILHRDAFFVLCYVSIARLLILKITMIMKII